jgi:hypothetical protein
MNKEEFAKKIAELHYPNNPNSIIDEKYRTIRINTLERQIIDELSERQTPTKDKAQPDSKALHIADVSKLFDFNDVFAPIEDALYATNSFTTDQARNIAEGIVQYIKDAGFDIIKVDNS